MLFLKNVLFLKGFYYLFQFLDDFYLNWEKSSRLYKKNLNVRSYPRCPILPLSTVRYRYW